MKKPRIDAVFCHQRYTIHQGHTQINIPRATLRRRYWSATLLVSNVALLVKLLGLNGFDF
jgi:hypothetical protein